MRRTIVLFAIGVLAVAGIVILAAVRPVVLLAIPVGAALGVAVYAYPRLETGSAPSGTFAPLPQAKQSTRGRGPLAVLVLGVALVSVFLFFGSGGGLKPKLLRPSIRDTPEDLLGPPGVRAVPYHARLEMARGGRKVTGQEVVRISRSILNSEGTSPTLAGPPDIGPEWKYAGPRGRNQDVYAFVHPYTHAIKPASGVGILRWNSLPVSVIEDGQLDTTLVPQDGSVVELHIPRRAVYGTDPDAKRGEDGKVLDFALNGLEDDPGARHIDIEVARGVGRWSVYEGIRQVTLWSFVKWLVPAVLLIVVAFFVNRFLKNRFPDAAAPAQA